jgi:hypothetical protein
MFLQLGGRGLGGGLGFTPGWGVISSNELPADLWRPWTVIPDDQRGAHPGYNNQTGCYEFGFRPPDLPDTPLFGLRGLRGGLGNLPQAFWVFVNSKKVPCPTCPPQLTCPTCPKCPTCAAPIPPPACSSCPAPTECPECRTPIAVAPAKFGVNIGLLVAGVLTAGTGYYGYRKGWFKRLGIGK